MRQVGNVRSGNNVRRCPVTVYRLDAYDKTGRWIGAWDSLDWPLTWALDLARQTWPLAVVAEVQGTRYPLVRRTGP